MHHTRILLDVFLPTSRKIGAIWCLEPGSKQKDCHLASNDAMGQADVPSM